MDPYKRDTRYLFYLQFVILSLLSTVVTLVPADHLFAADVLDKDRDLAINCPQAPYFIAATQLPQVCKDDQADVLSFTTTEVGTTEFVYILTGDDDSVMQVMSGVSMDFNDLLPGNYHVHGLAYLGTISAPDGVHISQVTASVCYELSANLIVVEVFQLDVNIDILSDFHGYPISKAGASDGQLQASATGGYGIYSYLWDTPLAQNTSTISDLSAGIYHVTISDEGGCVSSSSIQLQEPDSLEVGLESLFTYESYSLRCAGSNQGELRVHAQGGVPPYSYHWSGFTYTDSILSNLQAGTYEVIVTDDNGAQSHISAVLTAPDSMLSSVTKINPCGGQANGRLSIEVSGGVGPYQIRWSEGENSAELDGLTAGTYIAQISDQLGCMQELVIELEEIESLLVNHISENPLCKGSSDGWIALDVSGGMAPYRYEWAYEGGEEAQLLNIPEGVYGVIVMDQLDCQTEVEIELFDPAPLQLIPNIEPDNGTGSGSIELTVENGEAPYLFIWSHGDSSIQAQGLTIGTYSVRVQDANGCHISQEFEVPPTDRLECLEVHTGFTPNGDGVNETWHIPCIDWFPESEVIIYNRWGQVIYQATAYQNDWDGTVNGRPLPDGTYFYTLHFLNANDNRVIKGTVSILR